MLSERPRRRQIHWTNRSSLTPQPVSEIKGYVSGDQWILDNDRNSRTCNMWLTFTGRMMCVIFCGGEGSKYHITVKSINADHTELLKNTDEWYRVNYSHVMMERSSDPVIQRPLLKTGSGDNTVLSCCMLIPITQPPIPEYCPLASRQQPDPCEEIWSPEGTSLPTGAHTPSVPLRQLF